MTPDLVPPNTLRTTETNSQLLETLTRPPSGALVGVAAGSGVDVGRLSVVGAAPDPEHADSMRTDTARAAVRNFTGIPSDVGRDPGAR